MSTTHTSPTGSSESYLVKGLRDLEKDGGAHEDLRKQARNCLSYLLPNVGTESKTIRAKRKSELVGSIYNVEGLTDRDSIHVRGTKLRLWKTAARIMSMATKEEDKNTMWNNYDFDCTNAYRLWGYDTLNDSAFAAEIPGQQDTYRFWECDNQGRVTEKTIGPEGLSDRLGLQVSRVEELRRAKPCAHATWITQLEELSSWIVDQPDGTFVPPATHGEAEDWSPQCKMDAQQFRGIFGWTDPPLGKRSVAEAKKQLGSGSLNHETLREAPNEHNTKYGSYEKMASQQVGRILMADGSQHAIVRKLRVKRPDWDHAILAGCEYTKERGSDGVIRTRPDLANSRWFFPTDPDARPTETLYDAVTVKNGDIVDTTEVTAGRMRRDLSQAAITTSAESVDDEDDEDEGLVEGGPVTTIGKTSHGGSFKRKRISHGQNGSDGSE